MIADLRLQNFRSYADSSFEFDSGVNIIVGPNASGKTSLLEAVLVISRGRSFRANNDELIQHRHAKARLEAHTVRGDSRIIAIESKDGATTKQYRINEQALKRLPRQHIVPVVLFEPDHLRLLHGSPERRRLFMDDILEQTDPNYGTTLRHYKRALSQRNALLKQRPEQAHGQLFAWNVRLAELGEQLSLARDGLVQDINQQLSELYRQLSGIKSSHLGVEYQTTTKLDHYASRLVHQLESQEVRDFEHGFTAYGPHRDELLFTINHHPVQETASRGEVRTLLLVLKTIEAQLVEQHFGNKPLLLLDDVFGELDGKRRQALVAFLQPYQTFITTTDAELVVQYFTEKAHIIPLG